MSTGDPSYTLYGLTEEHALLRKSVRELAEDKIAPRATEIDESAEYPWDVHRELQRADLLGLHVPEEYGGAGADRIAHSIVEIRLSNAASSNPLSASRCESAMAPFAIAKRYRVKKYSVSSSMVTRSSSVMGCLVIASSFESPSAHACRGARSRATR